MLDMMKKKKELKTNYLNIAKKNLIILHNKNIIDGDIFYLNAMYQKYNDEI